MAQFVEGVDDERVLCRTLFNAEKKIVFGPLAYEQRYLKTMNILSLEKFGTRIKNILEFGCAELKFFTYMKNGMQHARSIYFFF